MNFDTFDRMRAWKTRWNKRARTGRGSKTATSALLLWSYALALGITDPRRLAGLQRRVR